MRAPLTTALLLLLHSCGIGLAMAQPADRAAAPGYPRVTAYFGPADPASNLAELTAQPTPGGFYRMALGPDGKGCERFQDFYQDNGERQSNELTSCDPGDLQRWELRGMQGQALGYRPTGQLRSRQWHDRGLPHGRDQYFDNRGKERVSFSWQHGKVHGPFKMKDISGQKRIEGVASQDKVLRISAWDHGRALSRTQAIALYNEARKSWFADMFH